MILFTSEKPGVLHGDILSSGLGIFVAYECILLRFAGTFNVDRPSSGNTIISTF